MSGITYHIKTDKKACVKLMSHISSFLFEEQYGELRYAPPIVTKRLNLALRGLSELIEKDKKK